MLDDNTIQLLLKISSEKHMGMTEIQKWSREQLGMNPRTTIRNVTKLVNDHIIKKIKIRGYGRDRYMVIPMDEDTTHRMYLKNMDSGKVIFWQNQKELAKQIEKNKNRFNENDYFGTVSMILWGLNIHNKLTWAINSKWFGSSKMELLLAKSNRKELEKILERTNETMFLKDYELWHTVLHTIYDITDSHRNLTKKEFKIIYS